MNNTYIILGAYDLNDGGAPQYTKVEELNTLPECIRLITTLVSDTENCYDTYLVIYNAVVVLDVKDWMLRE